MNLTPSGVSASLRQLLALATSSTAKRRFPFALRAGLSSGIPVVIGWFAGDIKAGLLATIGAFTALYGSGRPYRNRAVHLAAIAIALAAIVALGISVAPHPWFAAFIVAMIAALATFICNALHIGPPGAYMFALACASGTGMAGDASDPIRSGLYVLCGGIISWLSHMTGALLDRRGPERSAVIAAAESVANFVDSTGTPHNGTAQHQAARTLDEVWTTLVTLQPVMQKHECALDTLRQFAQQLHTIFACALTAAGENRPAQSSLAEEAREIGRKAKLGILDAISPPTRPFPLGRPRAVAALLEGLAPWSTPLLLSARVCAATLIAGAIGVALGLDRAYWGMAAVVVVLNQPYGWPGTLRRALSRVVGTLLGLMLAWCIFVGQLQGVWIAATVGLLQFLVEIWVVLQYAIAAIFITANAMTIAAGGNMPLGIAELFTARALDTAIGCAIAIAVFSIAAPRYSTRQFRSELVRTIVAAQRVLWCLSHRMVVTSEALEARRDLQHRAMALQDLFNADSAMLERSTSSATKIASVAAAAQALTYRLLNICWQIESQNVCATQPIVFDDCSVAYDWLESLKQLIETGSSSLPAGASPRFLGDEIIEIEKALRERS
ncbi:FUSC family protein [Paraburkholderia sp. EG287B]|uniref:FUSC family protein n=1 Tax=unclassified Paraburkholderia TaxID=2615204 RepID=UPI0034D2E430